MSELVKETSQDLKTTEVQQSICYSIYFMETLLNVLNCTEMLSNSNTHKITSTHCTVLPQYSTLSSYH